MQWRCLHISAALKAAMKGAAWLKLLAFASCSLLRSPPDSTPTFFCWQSTRTSQYRIWFQVATDVCAPHHIATPIRSRKAPMSGTISQLQSDRVRQSGVCVTGAAATRCGDACQMQQKDCLHARRMTCLLVGALEVELAAVGAQRHLAPVDADDVSAAPNLLIQRPAAAGWGSPGQAHRVAAAACRKAP